MKDRKQPKSRIYVPYTNRLTSWVSFQTWENFIKTHSSLISNVPFEKFIDKYPSSFHSIFTENKDSVGTPGRNEELLLHIEPIQR